VQNVEKQEYCSLLNPLAAIYGQVMHLRNLCYDRQWFKTHWLEVPVISVGNLTTGGTGKTPMVILLANLAGQAGLTPGIIMRGYGSKPGHDADEVLLLRRELPGVPIVADPDRIAGGKRAIEQSAQILIADDAFQHRRLGRDLNICLVDVCFPFGGGKILPAGRLRESLTGFKRADMVILTRCDQATSEQIDELKSKIRSLTDSIPILTSQHRVRRCVDASGTVITDLQGKKVFAFAAIGRSESFFNTLRESGVTLTGTRSFPDHHYYTSGDLQQIHAEFVQQGSDLMICTAKDMVKIGSELLKSVNIAPSELSALEIEMAMPSDDLDLLRQKISEVAARVPRI